MTSGDRASSGALDSFEFAPCEPLDEMEIPSAPPGFKLPDASGLQEFSIYESHAKTRPLISDLSPNEMSAMKKYLHRAYQKLADLSKVHPVFGRTLLHETWIHGSACANGVHQNWQFLPWHRGFVYFHERLLRSILGDEFRLPVWDWEKLTKVPEIYQQWPSSPLTPKGPPRCDDVQGWVTPEKVLAWLVNPPGTGVQEFVGYRPQSRADDPQSSEGAHADVHAAVGGMNGWMGNLVYAAADPVFYSHHCNVDRWWMAWERSYGVTWPDQPDYKDWLCEKCVFFDHLANKGEGKWVYLTVKDLLDTTKLGYRCDVPRVDQKNFKFDLVVTQGSLVLFSDPELRLLQTILKVLLSLNSTQQRVPPLIIHLRAKAKEDLAPGLYIIGLRKPDDVGAPVKLGGFGVFGQAKGMAMGMNTKMNSAKIECDLPISADSLRALLSMTGDSNEFEVIYQPASPCQPPPTQFESAAAHSVKKVHLQTFELRSLQV